MADPFEIGLALGGGISNGIRRYVDLERLALERKMEEDRLQMAKQDQALRQSRATMDVRSDLGFSPTMPGPYADVTPVPPNLGGGFYSPTAGNKRALDASLAEMQAKQAAAFDLYKKQQDYAQALQIQDESRKLLSENLVFTQPISSIERTQGPTLEGPPLSGLPEGFVRIPGTDQALNVKAKEDAMMRLLQSKRSSVAGPADPEAVRGAVEYYRQTGNMPAFGMGNTPLRAAFFREIGADGSQIISEGQAVKAERAGLSKAYATQQNFYRAEKTALGALDRQLDLAAQFSSKVDRTGSPLIAKYLLYAKGEVAGDEDTKALENIVTTASYEFAKIMSGSSASIQGVTIRSAEDAKKLLNAAMSKEQFKTILALMKQEGEIRLNARKQEIDILEQDLRRIGGQQSSKQDTDQQPPADERFTVGQTIQKNGKTYSYIGNDQWEEL